MGERGSLNGVLGPLRTILYGGYSRAMPSYPNWQRKRIQNPCSVSSSLTEGTTNRRSKAVQNLVGVGRSTL